MTVDYEIYGGTYADDLPTPDEVLTVDTVVRFIGTVGPDPEAAVAPDADAPAGDDAPDADAPAPDSGAPAGETPATAPAKEGE